MNSANSRTLSCANRRTPFGADRRTLFGAIWVALVLLWSLVRISVVAVWLSNYGVNTTVFAIIEITSSILYSVSSAKAVVRFIDRQRRCAMAWSLFALIGFLAPDVYVLTSGRSLPTISYVVIISLAIGIATSGVVALRRRILRSLRQRPLTREVILERFARVPTIDGAKLRSDIDSVVDQTL